MARAGLEPGTAGLQVSRTHHSATLPPQHPGELASLPLQHYVVGTCLYVPLKGGKVPQF